MQKKKYCYGKEVLTQCFFRCLFVVLLFSPIHLFAQEAQEGVHKQLAKEKGQREQDSLKHLLETGQADTIHYVYEEYLYDTIHHTCYGKGVKVDDGKSFISIIEVRPRIDSVDNELGNKSADVVWTLLGITVILVYICHLLITKYVYRGKLNYMLIYLVLCLLNGFIIYSILSCMYSNLDEIRVRKYAKEKIATVDSKGDWEQYRYRNHWETSYVLRYSFVFTGEDGIRMYVSQDNATFDRRDYPSETDTVAVKVRYDSVTGKLAIDNERYFIDNLCQILFMCFLLLLIFLLCCGKLIKPLKKLLDILIKRPVKPKEIVLEPDAIIDMPCIVYTSWVFTSMRYDSMDEFIRDVKRSEQQYGLGANEGLNPDRIIIKRSDFIITVFDEDITGDNDLSIEITSDNGESITEGELLFKLHNQMIPYVERLVVCTLEEVDFWGNPKEGKPVECTLMFDLVEQ